MRDDKHVKSPTSAEISNNNCPDRKGGEEWFPWTLKETFNCISSGLNTVILLHLRIELQTLEIFVQTRPRWLDCMRRSCHVCCKPTIPYKLSEIPQSHMYCWNYKIRLIYYLANRIWYSLSKSSTGTAGRFEIIFKYLLKSIIYR